MNIINKLKNKRQLNNGGYSLVEVLVTVLIIGIISVPLISTFVSSAKVNQQSRRMQDSTDVAQNLAEQLTSISLSELKTTYSPEQSLQAVNDATGNELFKANAYSFTKTISGAEGEEFSADVTMTPTAQYVLPKLRSFFGDSEIVCVREVGRYDRSAVIELGNNKSDVTKSSTINVETHKDGTYHYSIDLEYKNSSNQKVNKSLDLKKDTIANEDGSIAKDATFPTLYIVYDGFTIAGESCLDTIKINYTNDSNSDVKPVTVYFLPQNSEKDVTKVTKYPNLSMTYTSPGYTYSKNSPQNKLQYIFFDTNNKDSLVAGDTKVTTYEVVISIYYNSKQMTSVSTVCDLTE